MSNQNDIFRKHKSRCSERQKLIVSEEKRSKHTANNKDNQKVRQYQIDGDVITSRNVDKCDYLVLNDEKKTAYFIELKGSKMQHAIRQIKNTERMLKNNLCGYTSYYRVVFSGSATHSVNGSIFLSWKNTCGKKNGIFVVQGRRNDILEDI